MCDTPIFAWLSQKIQVDDLLIKVPLYRGRDAKIRKSSMFFL